MTTRRVRLDARQVIANAMSEKELVRNIVGAAQDLEYRVTHFVTTATEGRYRTALQGDRGFPDLVIANGRVCIFVEAKAQRGKTSADQDLWLAALTVTPANGPVQAYVWRPMEWIDGTITDVLMRGRNGR